MQTKRHGKEKRTVPNPEAHWYGFSKTKPEEKFRRVRFLFDTVAPSYDLMNDLMSVGMHRLWKSRLAAMMRPSAGQTILDVAGGTGDMALLCAGHTGGEVRVTVCDISLSMMREGRNKAIDKGFLKSIEWVACDAEKLPFAEESADAVCIAFGLRNVTRIDTALKEMTRVLKPGGRFFCLEFCPEAVPMIKSFYDIYSFGFLPWLGERVAGNREAYQYLVESIRKFPDNKELADRIKKAGLVQIRYAPLTFGIAAIHSAVKI